MTATPLKIHFELDGDEHEQVLDQDEVILGRQSTCDVVLRDQDVSISRRHAVLHRTETGWHVEDLGSKNGVRLNGKRVTEGRISNGDLLAIGSIEIRCSIKSAPVPATEGASVSFDDEERPTATAVIDLEEFRTRFESGDHAEATTGEPAAVKAKPVEGSADQEVSVVRLFYEAAEGLMTSSSLEAMLDRIVELVFRHVPAERATVCLVENDDLVPVAVRSKEGKGETALKLSRTIANQAMREKQAMLVEDTGASGEYQDAMSIVAGNIRSAMCVPLVRDGHVGGLIYVDTQNAARPFRQNDLELLSALSLLSALAVEQTRLRSEIERELRIRARLSRYSGDAVVEEIVGNIDRLEDEMLADKRVVTVLFADLSGFTTMAERIADPMRVTEILNSIFERLTAAVFECGGTLDKFIGDEVMAFFGAPLPQEDHAIRAVRAAILMQEYLAAYNEDLADDVEPLGMSIGINTGEVVVGDIGSTARRDYTVVGDTVNTAKRIETYAAERGQIAIGEATLEALGGCIECQPLREFQPKGKDQVVRTHLVVCANSRSELA